MRSFFFVKIFRLDFGGGSEAPATEIFPDHYKKNKYFR